MINPNSKLKIGFLLDRAATLKTYAPIIIEVLRRHLPATIIAGPDPKNSYQNNPSYRPIKENLLFPGSNKIEYLDFKDNLSLPTLLSEKKINCLLIAPFTKKSFDGILPKITTQNIKIYSVQWYADYLVMSPNDLSLVKNLFVYSQESINIYHQTFPKASSSHLSKLIPVGFPPLESLNHLPPKTTLKHQYKLPSNKPVITLFSLNIGKHDPFRLNRVFGASSRLQAVRHCLSAGKITSLKDALFSPRYENIVNLIKKWAHHQGATLIIKSRTKHTEPPYVKNVADLFITDDANWFPQTSFSVISISDLIFTFLSSATLESAALGVGCVNITAPHIPDPKNKSAAFYNAQYNTPGINITVDYRHLSKFLSTHTISDLLVNKAEQSKFITQYLSYNDRLASSRIIDHILKTYKI